MSNNEFSFSKIILFRIFKTILDHLKESHPGVFRMLKILGQSNQT